MNRKAWTEEESSFLLEFVARRHDGWTWNEVASAMNSAAPERYMQKPHRYSGSMIALQFKKLCGFENNSSRFVRASRENEDALHFEFGRYKNIFNYTWEEMAKEMNEAAEERELIYSHDFSGDNVSLRCDALQVREVIETADFPIQLHTEAERVMILEMVQNDPLPRYTWAKFADDANAIARERGLACQKYDRFNIEAIYHLILHPREPIPGSQDGIFSPSQELARHNFSSPNLDAQNPAAASPKETTSTDALGSARVLPRPQTPISPVFPGYRSQGVAPERLEDVKYEGKFN